MRLIISLLAVLALCNTYGIYKAKKDAIQGDWLLLE